MKSKDALYLNLRPQLSKDLIEELRKGNHVLLLGTHGLGKSHLAQELVAAQGKKRKKEKWIYC